MKIGAYYNEIDPYCFFWLENLIKAKLLPDGDVDGRSIVDVLPSDVMDYKECHFFAGIGVWAYAAKQCKVNDYIKGAVWTGSCPCQPFVSMGKKHGFADERHLWPDWFWLVDQCRPDIIFGEQSASAGGVAWLDLVRADLEGANYASGALDLYAAGFGAPHARRRLYWLGHTMRNNNVGDGWHGKVLPEPQQPKQARFAAPHTGGVDQGIPGMGSGNRPQSYAPLDGAWARADWLPCSDGRYRPVERGTFPLDDGNAINVDAVRAWGNAIVAPVAIEFIKAALEVLP